VIATVVMPQMGLEVSEGTVAAIQVVVGAEVREGDLLIEMETDKALTDVVAPRDGVVRAVEVEVGDTVAVGATLLLVADNADEPLTGAPAAPPAAADEPEVAAARGDAGEPEVAVAASGERATAAGGRLRAAPVARRAAAKLDIELADVDGTGPRGRITLRDVERVAAEGANGGEPPARAPEPAAAPTAAPAASAVPAGDGERVEPMSPVRRAIARRMTASQQIPQFTLTREVDASWLLEQKSALGASVTDLLLQAMAVVVLRHPALAVSYTETADGAPALLHRDGVDLGLAVATPRGLVVPVVRGAHALTLSEIAAQRGRLVGEARSGRLRQDDMSGAVMTLSSLSTFGVDQFTAMLNPGESAILAVGRTVERVVPRGRGLTVVPTSTFSLTIDHRVADGATGAAALVELAELLGGAATWRP